MILCSASVAHSLKEDEKFALSSGGFHSGVNIHSEHEKSRANMPSCHREAKQAQPSIVLVRNQVLLEGCIKKKCYCFSFSSTTRMQRKRLFRETF